MYTIASIFDPESDQKIHTLWQLLDSKCSLKGIQLTPLPHISWQTSEDYDLDQVHSALTRFSTRQKSVLVRSTGLGIFTGERIVLYLAIVRSEHLTKLHDKLWDLLNPYGKSRFYYAPDYWVPHITLANKDLNNQNMPCALSELCDKSLNFEITINSIAILYDIQGEIGVKSIYKFNG